MFSDDYHKEGWSSKFSTLCTHGHRVTARRNVDTHWWRDACFPLWSSARLDKWKHNRGQCKGHLARYWRATNRIWRVSVALITELHSKRVGRSNSDERTDLHAAQNSGNTHCSREVDVWSPTVAWRPQTRLISFLWVWAPVVSFPSLPSLLSPPASLGAHWSQRAKSVKPKQNFRRWPGSLRESAGCAVCVSAARRQSAAAEKKEIQHKQQVAALALLRVGNGVAVRALGLTWPDPFFTAWRHRLCRFILNSAPSGGAPRGACVARTTAETRFFCSARTK